MTDSLSPLDGRYLSRTQELRPFFSEAALILYRIKVETHYLYHVTELVLSDPNDKITNEEFHLHLVPLYQPSDVNEVVTRIKQIEQVTNHDVKAVEYYLKEKLKNHPKFSNLLEFIHFGLTSQDINQTALPMMIKDATEHVINPTLVSLTDTLTKIQHPWREQPMLARTHGQPATPTTMGKELLVFVYRLQRELTKFSQQHYYAKFGGAVGNLNAHYIAYPKINWDNFADSFIAGFGLRRSTLTTQIESYDWLAEYCHHLIRINTILIDLNRDIWTYISMEYFRQEINPGEVGSSTMPHKVNPIDFENSEGNLGLSNALLSHFATKLPISRLQRDLTDSTVTRNIGVALGYSLLAYKSLLKGLSKLQLNPEAINADLNKNWLVVAEAIQTILRRERFPGAYEALKEFTRTNQVVTQESTNQFIDSLEIPEEIKTELKQITPFNYLGTSKHPVFSLD